MASTRGVPPRLGVDEHAPEASSRRPCARCCRGASSKTPAEGAATVLLACVDDARARAHGRSRPAQSLVARVADTGALVDEPGALGLKIR